MYVKGPVMPAITFIGAGWTVFAKNLLGDILSFPELAATEIRLMDIDPERLRTSEIMAHKVAEALGVAPKIVATTDRRAALDGADYAINMIQVAGYKPGTVVDFEIPKKYGLRQTIADTLGIGGIMRALRTIPVSAGYLQGYGRSLSRGAVPELRQPDGDELFWASGAPAKSARLGCATASRARPSSWRRISVCRLRRSTTCAPGSTTWRFTLNSSATDRTCTR